MEWMHPKLDEIAYVVGGSTPRRSNEEYWGDDILWVTPTDLPSPGTGIVNVEETGSRITQEGLDSCSASLLPEGTVLFSSRATIGKVAIAAKPLATNQGFANFIPKRGVESRYLAYALMFSRERIAALAGSTTFKEVSKSALRPFRIPLPPPSEQHRIVEILDQADALRKKRAEADKIADRILPAFFYKMFGDPATNPKGWDVVSLGAVTQCITKGESPKWQGFSYVEEGPVFITSENVRWGSLDLSSKKHIPAEFHKKLKRSSVRENDILVNLVGASIGRCCVVPKAIGEANVNQAVAVVTPQAGYSSHYICAYLLSPYTQQIIHGGKVEGARANISLIDLRRLPLPDPPNHLLKSYEGACQKIEATRENRAAVCGRINTLFDSVLHRAFSGELTAKWREAHMKELLQEMEQQAKELGISDSPEV